MSGPYGTVYADTTYYYSDSSSYPWTDFDVALYANNVPQEIPQKIKALSKEKEGVSLYLSAISVVRIFKAAPGYVVVSANYSHQGNLYSLSVNGSKNGDWVHSNELVEIYGDTFVHGKGTREFGLPQAFPMNTFNITQALKFPLTKLTSVLDVIHFHYNRNIFVRQILYPSNEKPVESILSFEKTKEDAVLDPIDEKRPFGSTALMK